VIRAAPFFYFEVCMDRTEFLERVTMCPITGAWWWNGSRFWDGYGRLYSSESKKSIKAHRLAWELFVGPIPEGMKVCHKYEELGRHNVNPDHLFLGTQRDNIQDAVKKGRMKEQKVTHCPQGHEYTPDNIYWKMNGTRRQCKICAKQRVKKYKEKMCQISKNRV
jgi:hypothetical protein